jgi:hypothetical protein
MFKRDCDPPFLAICTGLYLRTGAQKFYVFIRRRGKGRGDLGPSPPPPTAGHFADPQYRHTPPGFWECQAKTPPGATRRAPFLIFAGPRRADPARSIQPLFSEGTPLGGGTALAARPGAGGVSAAPPGGGRGGAAPRDPRASPDHPTWWLVPPGAHHGQ